MPPKKKNDNEFILSEFKKIKTKIDISKANPESPINLVIVKICQKPKGKNKPKWEKWTPELVYKPRGEPNNDIYLKNRITRMLTLKEEFIIKEIKEIKFLGYGKFEDE